MRTETEFHGYEPRRDGLRALAIAWRALCVPVHSVLALIEPIANIILGLLALLGICMSLAFRFVRPGFPFWTMMAVSLGLFGALMLYHTALRITESK